MPVHALAAGADWNNEPAPGWPLPLTTLQYTNRPSGIHQVLQLAP